MTDLATAKVYNEFSNLNDLKLQARRDDPEAINAVASQFESIFLETVLASARHANEAMGEGDFGSDQMKYIYDMFDHQMAHVLSYQGLGVAKHISHSIHQQQQTMTKA